MSKKLLADAVMYQCKECRQFFTMDEVESDRSGDPVCKECRDEVISRCLVCGSVIKQKMVLGSKTVGTLPHCDRCIEQEKVIRCHSCNKRIIRADGTTADFNVMPDAPNNYICLPCTEAVDKYGIHRAGVYPTPEILGVVTPYMQMVLCMGKIEYGKAYVDRGSNRFSDAISATRVKRGGFMVHTPFFDYEYYMAHKHDLEVFLNLTGKAVEHQHNNMVEIRLAAYDDEISPTSYEHFVNRYGMMRSMLTAPRRFKLNTFGHTHYSSMGFSGVRMPLNPSDLHSVIQFFFAWTHYSGVSRRHSEYMNIMKFKDFVFKRKKNYHDFAALWRLASRRFNDIREELTRKDKALMLDEMVQIYGEKYLKEKHIWEGRR